MPFSVVQENDYFASSFADDTYLELVQVFAGIAGAYTSVAADHHLVSVVVMGRTFVILHYLGVSVVAYTFGDRYSMVVVVAVAYTVVGLHYFVIVVVAYTFVVPRYSVVVEYTFVGYHYLVVVCTFVDHHYNNCSLTILF